MFLALRQLLIVNFCSSRVVSWYVEYPFIPSLSNYVYGRDRGNPFLAMTQGPRRPIPRGWVASPSSRICHIRGFNEFLTRIFCFIDSQKFEYRYLCWRWYCLEIWLLIVSHCQQPKWWCLVILLHCFPSPYIKAQQRVTWYVFSTWFTLLLCIFMTLLMSCYNIRITQLSCWYFNFVYATECYMYFIFLSLSVRGNSLSYIPRYANDFTLIY